MDNDLIPKKKQDEEDNWALTLADMMTLLLCFFVLMLAVAKVDKEAYSEVAESLSQAMGGKFASEFAALHGKKMRESVSGSVQESRNMFEMQLTLARMLKLDTSAVRLSMRPDSVAIELKGNVFFQSGSSDLTPKAEAILAKVGRSLSTQQQYLYTVEGHTDNIPMNSARFPSNWELSAARAATVARTLITHGVNPTQVQVLGLADTRPVVNNDTPANRSRNRRVIILVKPKSES